MWLLFSFIMRGTLVAHNSTFMMNRNEGSIKTAFDLAEPEIKDQITGLMAAKKNYTSCISDILSSGNYNSTSPKPEVIRFLCKSAKTESWQQCHKTLEANLQPYLANRKGAVDLDISVTDSMLNYACDDDAKALREFDDSKGNDCMNPKGKKIRNCVAGLFSGRNGSLELDDLTEARNVFSTKAKACSKLGEINNCIVQDFENCESKTSGIAMNNIFSVAKNALNCTVTPAPN